jgi:hypothetical protein
MSSIRPKVVARLQTDLSDRWRVVDNTADDKKVVGGQIPDVLLYEKDSKNDDVVLFVLKIENGGELVDSLSQWQALSKLPSSFYIVVPDAKLDAAKKLASATNVKARFASYKKENDEVTDIQYE